MQRHRVGNAPEGSCVSLLKLQGVFMNKEDAVKYSSFPHISHEHLDLLMKCFSICSSCTKMCTEENRVETALLCSDCADVCALTIKLHCRDSEFNPQLMELCAEVCRRCAEECAESDAEHCLQCSRICEECAQACSE